MVNRLLFFVSMLSFCPSMWSQDICKDLIRNQYISLDDVVRSDSSRAVDVLKPRPLRRRDLPEFEFVLPRDPSHQVLQLMDSFEDTVKIYVNDSLFFSGSALTNFSTSMSNVKLDLGERSSGGRKQLRIMYQGHCMETRLANEYPIVEIYQSEKSWLLNYSDYWSDAE